MVYRVGASPFSRGRKLKKLPQSAWRMDGLDTSEMFFLGSCPFCGARPSARLHPMGEDDGDETLMTIEVFCGPCGISMQDACIDDCVKRWNKRTESPYTHQFNVGAMLGEARRPTDPYIIRHGDPPAG